MAPEEFLQNFCRPCLALTSSSFPEMRQDVPRRSISQQPPARRGRFDFIVVSLSLVALGPLQVPVVVIRSMRAFRIARLFRRIKSLSSIIMALTASIIPVINAYLVLLIAMCICELPQRPTPAIGSPRAT